MAPSNAYARMPVLFKYSVKRSSVCTRKVSSYQHQPSTYRYPQVLALSLHDSPRLVVDAGGLPHFLPPLEPEAALLAAALCALDAKPPLDTPPPPAVASEL